MQDPNLFSIFTDKLIDSGVEYFITGSVASIIFGEPRVTHDIDIVVHFSESQIELLSKTFPLDQFYLPPKEIISIELGRTVRGHFNIIHISSGFKADIYLSGSDRLENWAFNHIRRIKFKRKKLSVAPPEYVICRKLEYYREGRSDKHLNDIRSILKHSSEIIDFEILQKFIKEQRVSREWKLVSEK